MSLNRTTFFLHSLVVQIQRAYIYEGRALLDDVRTIVLTFINTEVFNSTKY